KGAAYEGHPGWRQPRNLPTRVESRSSDDKLEFEVLLRDPMPFEVETLPQRGNPLSRLRGNRQLQIVIHVPFAHKAAARVEAKPRRQQLHLRRLDRIPLELDFRVN